MYEQMGGQVFYIGKPHNKAYTIAMNHFEHHNITKPREILMVGDTPETDIRGARSFQLQLMKELDFVQRIMWEEFQPTQLNVATIGNKTPQIHKGSRLA